MISKPTIPFKTILPPIIAIALFMIATFFLIIPQFEKNILDKKKEMIKELTNAASSILENYHAQEEAGTLSKNEAQKRAISEIETLNYGSEKKDYFWITDMTPRMIVHPYRKDLNGKDLTNYQDANKKRLFVEFVKVVEKSNEGYVNYYWQWKDDKKKIVPKLSYVKKFAPWGWVIGTGIYVEDVREEISTISNRIWIIATVITLILAGILLYIILQNIKTETARQIAEQQLQKSKERYQALVEASTEGAAIVMNGRYIYANHPLLNMLKMEKEEFLNSPIPENINLKSSELIKQEVTINDNNFLLNISKITISNQSGHILIFKELSAEKKKQSDEKDNLITELQASLMYLNRPIKSLTLHPFSCRMSDPISKVTKMMDKNNYGAILVKSEAKTEQIIGIVTDEDLRKRVINNHDVKEDMSVFAIMSSPIIAISERALMFEAALLMQEKSVKYLAVKDNAGNINGLISNSEILQVQKYSSSLLIKEISRAKSFEEIQKAHERVELIAKTLFDSGVNAHRITRILSSIANSTIVRLIDLEIEKSGKPPVSFNFVIFGSSGREEQTLITDQDNAIIYADHNKDEKVVHQYFISMGNNICNQLNELGYNYCDREIMANNPAWCQPIATWKKNFTQWIINSTPENLLETNIFFDQKLIYGDKKIFINLRQTMSEALEKTPLFFHNLAKNNLAIKPPLSFFGNIVVETEGEHQKTFNIKQAILPFINFARIYALKHSIEDANTIERIDKLLDIGQISNDSHDEFIEAFDFLIKLRLKHQAVGLEEDKRPDNHVNPKELTPLELETLKKVLAAINIFQSKLSYDFVGQNLA